MAARGLFKSAKFLIKGTVAGVTAFFVVPKYVVGTVTCNGPSMEPTVRPGDILLTDRITPRLLGNIVKGDVVIAKSPRKEEYVCKRVVAVAGESVMFEKKVLKIPENHYWLEGDNKINSTDSRTYGPVPEHSIRDRCIWKIWPMVNLSFKDVGPGHCEARTQLERLGQKRHRIRLL